MDTSGTKKNNPELTTITIRSVMRQAEIAEQLPSFDVHVRVQAGNHQVAWTMAMMPGARVPIRLDESQEVILLIHEQELFVDSSGLDKTTPVHLAEGDPEKRE